MWKLRRNLSQNFLHNRELVKKLIRSSSIGKNDLVLEIGLGEGIIIDELLEQSRHIIGIEIDFDLFKFLQDKYADKNNLTLYLGDALSFPVPRGPYKVFSNIPFAIEGELVRKLLNDSNPPLDCYLVIRKDLAERLSGLNGNNLFYVSNKPFFDFSIFHYFRRHDFRPTPKVEAVMFRFQKRIEPLIPFEEKQKYQNFIKTGFGNGQPVYQNLKTRYGKERVIQTFIKLNIRKDSKPSYISLENWINLFKLLR